MSVIVHNGRPDSPVPNIDSRALAARRTFNGSGDALWGAGEPVIITIVCHCGNHNQVSEHELEVAHCLRCFRLLLPASRIAPAALAVSLPSHP